MTNKFIPIAKFHQYTPLFYVGMRENVDNMEVYKYKGFIPDYLTHFFPLDGIHKEEPVKEDSDELPW